MDGEAGWWTKIRIIVLPPQTRVKGVGRQQQQIEYLLIDLADVYILALLVYIVYILSAVVDTFVLNLVDTVCTASDRYYIVSIASVVDPLL